jgi:3-oxochol-4-en-24-oyl-CoA dehydrogenase
LPIASTDEQVALASSLREWAKRAGTIDVVRSQEPGGTDAPGAADRWAGLTDLGIFGIGIPETAGGAGGTAADLAVVVFQATQSLVPGPLLPTLLAGQLLAGCADAPLAREVRPALHAGRVSVAVALSSGSLTALPRPDGTLALNGTTAPVLGAGTTTHLLMSAPLMSETGSVRAQVGSTGRGLAWFLIDAGHPGITIAQRDPADFSRALADVSADAALITPAAQLPGLDSERVSDVAAALLAVEAAAVASWCSATAAEYAVIRHQFGRPIGSFQAVKHLCAGMLARAQTAAVLAADAARAIGEPGELPLIAAAAAAHAADAGVANAKDCIQVLGGIGFTWEHDAHLYLRRALSIRQLLGGTSRWRTRAARLAMAGTRRTLSLAGAVDTPDLAAVRSAARDLAESVLALPAGRQRGALADSGYAMPDWPAPYGLGATAAARLVIDDEFARAGLARPDLGIGAWAIPAILGHGTQDQADRFAGPTLRGEISWCQLFSEPEAGSDLASLRTRAERTDGGWLVTGQKVWTSLARQADWGICLARIDSSRGAARGDDPPYPPRATKHEGITCFLVAMDSPGIEIRPLREMTGREMFNQVFLEQVFVPDACVVGAPGAGWRVARTTLASERVAMGAGSSVGTAAEDLLELAAALDAGNDRVTLDRIGGLVAEGMAISLLDLQAVLAQLRGDDPGSLAAVRKLAGVAHRQAVAETALDLFGPSGAAADRDGAAALHEFLLTRCLSIAGGTTQILLSLIAERQLGLPRDEAR